MWFKNCRLFYFNTDERWSTEAVEAALREQAFKPCPKTMPNATGWVPPNGVSDHQLAYHADGYTLLKLRKEERILPSSVVNDALREAIEDEELKSDRKITRWDKMDLKDRIVIELLPRAFTRSRYTSALIDHHRGLLFLDTSSDTVTDAFFEALKDALGYLPVSQMAPPKPLVEQMTQWVKQGSTESAFALAESCELRAAQRLDSVVRVTNTPLDEDEIHNHLAMDRKVTQLGLLWNEDLELKLNQNFTIKAIKWSSEFKEKAQDNEHEDPLVTFDANIILMSAVLSDMAHDLLALTGTTQEATQETTQATTKPAHAAKDAVESSTEALVDPMDEEAIAEN